MTVLHSDDDIAFTDITAIVTSDTGSTTGLFGGTVAGNQIYLGFATPYTNTKVKVDTAGVIEPENVSAEYWNGTAWTSNTFMAVSSTYDPFSSTNQRGNRIAAMSGMSEQWHYNFDPYGIEDDWVPNTINGEEKYWARFRVTADITTDAIIEQVKIGPSRVEIEATGIFRAGLARYPKILTAGMATMIKNKTQDAKKDTVNYTSTIGLEPEKNKFESDQHDGFAYVQKIEDGIDTSIRYKIEIAFYGTSSIAGDVEFGVDAVLVGQTVNAGSPFVFDGSAIAEFQNTIYSMPSAEALVRQVVTFYADISSLVPGDNIVFNINRDATAGNTNDTYGGDIIIEDVEPVAYFWKD